MKTKLIFTGLIALVLAFLAWFAIGGGFSSVEVVKEEHYSLTIYGKLYDGSLKEKEVSLLFAEVEKELNGKPMYVYYEGIPSKDNDYSVKMIIGGLDSFEGTVKRRIEFTEVYSARHDSHYMLNKAQNEILNSAKEGEIDLDMSKMIEVYYSQDDLEVMIPALSK